MTHEDNPATVGNPVSRNWQLHGSGRNPKPRPPAQGRQAFSVREAPENLVYGIFFSELMGSQREADQRQERGKDGGELRSLFQHRFQLNDAEHQALISAAQACVTAIETNRQARQEIAKELKLAQDKAPLWSRLKQLAQSDEAATKEGVGQLRLSLGAERFAELDWIIRVHVVPNLKLVPASALGTTTPGGK